eukprot:Blabericola_migrator_1__1073@NODE_1273_length_4923_cov_16_538715_g858_i0_p4_GENE_NODE_1273_length_4923_cov_16_538715_g858_i0NODE_1273_length_4923_cov_16_538715_g858_i0_p4_ORF_typecomplete_len113_score0_29TauE/PF01925_19/0_0058Transgly_assoc/PF04226_13/1_1e04Transgly_assoc/PF04226_13/0_0147TM_GPCR_Srw/PF10324_9/0_049_NODE_1273_length_4923_cov_16_538715_g858_i0296634
MRPPCLLQHLMKHVLSCVIIISIIRIMRTQKTSRKKMSSPQNRRYKRSNSFVVATRRHRVEQSTAYPSRSATGLIILGITGALAGGILGAGLFVGNLNTYSTFNTAVTSLWS